MRRSTLILLVVLAVVIAGCGGGAPEPQTGRAPTVMDVTDLFDTLQARTVRVLGTVTGARSAQEAVPQLQEISGRYDDLLAQVGGLPSSVRSDLAAKAGRALPGLRDNAVRLASMDGGEVIEPVLREIVNKVAKLQ